MGGWRLAIVPVMKHLIVRINGHRIVFAEASPQDADGPSVITGAQFEIVIVESTGRWRLRSAIADRRCKNHLEDLAATVATYDEYPTITKPDGNNAVTIQDQPLHA